MKRRVKYYGVSMVGFLFQQEWSFEVFLFLPDNLSRYRLFIHAIFVFAFFSLAVFHFRLCFLFSWQ
jgi:hypothetical protein